MKIRSIIVDDEKHGRENLFGILNEYCPEVEIAGKADSVESALSLISIHSPELIFLDVEMPGINGFQLLEHLQDFSFEVIFVTAYDNYAIKAIRFSAADYILKPVNYKDLQAAVGKVANRIAEKQENQRLKQLYRNLRQPGNQRIGLPAGDHIEYADITKIVRCQGEGNYTHIYMSDSCHRLVAKTLMEFEDLLQEYGFIRVHKTHLVNLQYIASYIRSQAMVKLTNGELIPVSRRRKDAVLESLKVHNMK